jgi:hypothetical protein
MSNKRLWIGLDKQPPAHGNMHVTDNWGGGARGSHRGIPDRRSAFQMSYFEMLRQGSPFHKVHINSERAITILPVDDGDVDWIRFQQVVAEAEENAG